MIGSVSCQFDIENNMLDQLSLCYLTKGYWYNMDIYKRLVELNIHE